MLLLFQCSLRHRVRSNSRSRVLRSLQNIGQRMVFIVLFEAQRPEAILAGKSARRHSVAPRYPVLEQPSADHVSQEHGGIFYPLHEPNLYERGNYPLFKIT